MLYDCYGLEKYGGGDQTKILNPSLMQEHFNVHLTTKHYNNINESATEEDLHFSFIQ